MDWRSYNQTKNEQIKIQVINSIDLYAQNNIPALQQQLYELYLNFNKSGGGRLIINYPQKEQLAECFTLMLRFDWGNDDDISEVWAENGFYCLIEYINNNHSQQDQIVGGLDLFLHLFYGRKYLKPKINDILLKAQLRHVFVFDDDDYNSGADYIINQFLFFSAQIIKPIVLKHDNILFGSVKTCFYDILKEKSFNHLSTEKIFMKAKFISKVIGSILEDA